MDVYSLRVHLKRVKSGCRLFSKHIVNWHVFLFLYLQNLDGCVCVNPGCLTKKASGGTFVKIVVKDQPQMNNDFSSDIGVKIVHI